MLRFYYVLLVSLCSIAYFVPKMAYYAKHRERYSEEACYDLAQNIIHRIQKAARIHTEYEGQDNLPEQSGYMMFANHQGRYDGLGVLAGHNKPCSVLMDKKRSQLFIAKQFVDLLGGQRIDKYSLRQQIQVINTIAKEVARGRNYLIFPEGGYPKNKRDNTLAEFKYGCFVSALKAKCAIVPVALIDSYKPFGINSLRKVQTKVIYLPPIPYEEYGHMKAKEVCRYVKNRIEAEIFRQEQDALKE